MKDKGKSTRAPARIGAYALNRQTDEVARLLNSLEPEDYDSFTNMVKKNLTPAGLALLKTIMQMTFRTPIFGGPGVAGRDDHEYQVKPFTRDQLGNYLRKGERLIPHDIKLLNDLVRLTVLRCERQPLPAMRMLGRSGDELMLGAGWQYVYIVAPIAALSLLWSTNKHHDYIAGLRTDQRQDLTLEPQDSAWKRWLKR